MAERSASPHASKPADPDAGRALFEVERRLAAGDFARAEGLCRDLLRRSPSCADAYWGLGRIALALEQEGLARDHLETAARLRPDRAEFHDVLAAALLALDDAGAAEAACRRAIELAPDSARARCRLGEALREQGRLAEAEQALHAALSCDAGHFRTLIALGNLMRDRLDMPAAREHYDRALQSKPDSALARWNLALLDLFEGRFESGWRGYGAGPAAGQRALRALSYPSWQGDASLEGALLVTAEQGLGDEIMFASCIPDLVARGMRCILECDRRLAPLFARSFERAIVQGVERADESWIDATHQIAAQVAAGDLARFLRPERARFPRHAGYLRADEERIAAWRRRLEALVPQGGLRVGISWRGGARPAVRRERSIPWEAWTPLAVIPGVTLVPVQYDADETDRHAFKNAGITPLWLEGLDAMADIDDLAALLCSLDLLITVDNSTAHLCGALGRPGWLLLAPAPDWRWLAAGDDTLWYPSLKLFRSERPREWGSTMMRVAGDLRRMAGDGGTC